MQDKVVVCDGRDEERGGLEIEFLLLESGDGGARESGQTACGYLGGVAIGPADAVLVDVAGGEDGDAVERRVQLTPGLEAGCDGLDFGLREFAGAAEVDDQRVGAPVPA